MPAVWISRVVQALASSLALEFRKRGVAITGDKMVVDHANRLHERVDDGRPNKFETTSNEFFRHFLRHGRFRRYQLGRAEMIDLRLAVEMVPEKV